eukprot:TRINITY_DN72910_c0_g1_i1.p1 TRINITY_DN72910_c0_g1~~TRINITY_DN72910_c0_g1_i1.p1  ORF type:complete len:388 (+),score=92.69 TRINITY_DN72910_c0_g1_i1:56-1165(+)
MAIFTKLAFVTISLSGTVARAADTCSDEVAELKKQLAAARASLESCTQKPISVVSAATGAYSLGADAVNHLLDKTNVDEQLSGMVADGFGKAKLMSASVADKVMSVDYAGYVKELKSHDLYQTHVEKNLRPVVDQYVSPALEKASAQVGPAFESAKVASHQAFDTVSEHAPKRLDEAGLYIDRVLDPVFDALAKVTPGFVGSYPTNRVDRVIFILLGCFVTYHLIALTLWILRINVRLAMISLRVAKKLLYIAIMLPLRIVGFAFWICTGFYCCGLCRRKSSQTKKGDDAKASKEKDGLTVTVDEIKKLLDNAKKEKKLEAGVKQLLTLMKNGKPMTGPKNLAGKKVSKDVLTKAVGQFKELDAKKLGL